MEWDFIKLIGLIIAILALVALWVIPDPIGKIVEFWKFWRDG